MFKAYVLPAAKYRFGAAVGPDKYRGVQEFGPFQPVDLARDPVFGFVFPREYRDLANQLYVVLKNGLGYFRGLPSMFKIPLARANVFQVSDFSIPDGASPRDEARRYADAIIGWSAKQATAPDIFLVIHPRTSDWLDQTPYYECKALLLKEGLLSQHITTDLMHAKSQFEWAVANIALQIFAKLGGKPWILDTPQPDRELLLGVGSSSLLDPTNRQLRRYLGFTCCFSGSGDFQFLSLSRAADNRDDYLTALRRLVHEALERTATTGQIPDQITLHLSKDSSREERAAVESAVSSATAVADDTRIHIVRVNESPNLFAVDPDSADGVPNRGSTIQIGDREFLVYTEGREERQVWRQRTPTCLRVIPQDSHLSAFQAEQLVAQAYRISQANWRAFNAGARPITTFYGSLIAKVLSHVPASAVTDLQSDKARQVLEHRMWFL